MRWSFDLTCPKCGKENIEVVNSGRFSNREATAVLHCPQCEEDWLLRVDIIRVAQHVYLPGDMGHRREAECGTDGGYRRHLRYHQEPCAPCRAAHVTANSEPARTGVFI